MLAGSAPEEALAPYQPFLEALRHYFASAPEAELRAAVSEYGPELARLVPELRRRVPDLPAAPPVEPESERYRLFESVVGLLTAIRRARRSCSCSTTCTGPTARRCCCFATWRAPRSPRGC